jgi:O-antigen ligase
MKKVHFVIAVIALLSYFPAILSYYRIYYALIVVVFCCSLWLSSLGYIQRRGVSQNAYHLLAFFIYLGLTAVWADVPKRTLEGVAIDSIFLLVWAISFLLQRNYKEKEIARIFLCVPYVVAATFIYLMMTFGALRPYDEQSTGTLGATANLCAQWLVVALPFIYWFSRQGDKRRYRELFLTLFLIAIAESRTGYILAVLCLLTEGYLYGKSARRFVLETLKLVLVLLLLVGLAWWLPPTRPLVEGGFDRAVVRETSNGAEYDVERLWMFQEGWQSFIDHPLLGIGYENLGERVAAAHGYEIVSHNILITLIAESGWPGFLLFVGLIVEFCRRTGWGIAGGEEGTGAFYIACRISMVIALLTGMAYPLLEFPLFYVVLGIGCAAKRKHVAVERHVSSPQWSPA